MGVDFYPCGVCGEIFGDCGEYYTCLSCEHYLCAICGRKADEEYGSVENDMYGDDPAKCEACAGDIVLDAAIVKFLLEKYNLQHENIVEEIRESRK